MTPVCCADRARLFAALREPPRYGADRFIPHRERTRADEFAIEGDHHAGAVGRLKRRLIFPEPTATLVQKPGEKVDLTVNDRRIFIVRKG